MRFPTMVVALGLSLALAGTPALADNLFGPVPVIAPGVPAWAPIPGAPGVQYAPNVRSDLFRYQGSYYCQHQGRWYRGTGLGGPWAGIQNPPPAFYQIQAPYFKVPPGWARGKKKGWGQGHLPPGQAKKYGGGTAGFPTGQLLR